MSTTYVDGTTPLDAAHMNALQQKVEKGAPSGYVGLDSSSNVTLPANLVVNGAAMVAATFYIGNAYDTNLYRASAGILKTDGALQVAGSFQASNQIYGKNFIRANAQDLGAAAGNEVIVGLNNGSFTAGPYIAFGPNNGWDTNLYRLAAGNLKTDGTLQAAGSFVASTAGAGSVYVRNDSGRLYFGVNDDASLYRGGASNLKTDGAFQAGTTVYANTGTGQQVIVGYSTATGVAAALSLGPGNGDTNLYRLGANSLKTDGAFAAGGVINAQAGVAFGSPADTNLYRTAAATLNLDGFFFATVPSQSAAIGGRRQGDTGWRWYIGSDGAINWGLAAGTYDTALSRYSAGILSTPGTLFVGLGSGPGSNGLMVFDNNAAGQARVSVMNNGIISWGSGGAVADTNLYRAGTGTLQTDSALIVAGGYLQSNGPLWLADSSASAAKGLLFGSSQDTLLYRAAAGQLKTNTDFYIVAKGGLAANETGLIVDGAGVAIGLRVLIGDANTGGPGRRALCVAVA